MRRLVPVALLFSLVACSEPQQDVVVETTSVQNPSSPQTTTQRLPDPESPTVASTTPAANQSMVTTTTEQITVTFSKPMDPMSITASSFSLECPAGARQEGMVAYEPRGNVATFSLLNSLPTNSTCVATIGTGVTDMAGTALSGRHSWTFLTGNGAPATP